MGGQTRRPILGLVLVALFIACIGVVSTSHTVRALSTDVKVAIPEAIVTVTGKTSPYAQIKIYENGSTLPTASTVADSSGSFSKELPQMTVGIVDVSVQAVDTNGATTVLITKQVATVSHETATLDFILPPTISHSPSSIPYQTGTLEFKGRATPGATVTITIEPSTILTVEADSEGNYTVPLSAQSLGFVSIYLYGVQMTIGSETSEYRVVDSFVVAPPTQPPVQGPSDLFHEARNTAISPPEILFPNESEYTSSGPIIITGRASPGADITLYDDGTAIGTVLAGSDGSWQFYFVPRQKSHVIFARACQYGSCSASSRTITILQPSTDAQVCTSGITLDSYRLTTRAGNPAQILINLSPGNTGIIYISWGDETNERFDTPSGDQLKAAHTYQGAGIYSGYVIVSDKNRCQSASYFAVEVTAGPLKLASLLAAVLVILGSCVIATWLFVSRRSSHLRP